MVVQFCAGRADTLSMVLSHASRPDEATFRRRRRIALLSIVTVGLAPWLLSPRNAADAAAAPEPIRAAAAKADPTRVAAGNLKTAVTTTRLPAVTTTVATGKVPARTTTAESLVANARLTLSDNARADLLAGNVDARLVALLGQILEKHRIEITVISTGHGRYVKGTGRVSNHVDGRAVDIAMVDGTDVSSTNAAARGLIDELFQLDSAIRPTELGGPWDVDGAEGIGFTDSGHREHLHVGYDA
jgi:hypothetical protein